MREKPRSIEALAGHIARVLDDPTELVVPDFMTLEMEQAHVEMFYIGEKDGRLYDNRTEDLASTEDWQLWFDIRLKWRYQQQNFEDQRAFRTTGYDRRIGGGISWNRSNRG